MRVFKEVGSRLNCMRRLDDFLLGKTRRVTVVIMTCRHNVTSSQVRDIFPRFSFNFPTRVSTGKLGAIVGAENYVTNFCADLTKLDV
jgi:hypothetical protein